MGLHGGKEGKAKLKGGVGCGVLDLIMRKREKCVKGSHLSLKYAEADRPRSTDWLGGKFAFWEGSARSARSDGVVKGKDEKKAG